MPEARRTDPTATPAVAVIMPTYNSARTVERAIASVVAQTCPNWVLYVVDDASGDETRDRVSRLAAADPRIRLIALPENVGPAGARNAGLAEVDADWVAVLDADDAWQSDRLDTLLSFAAAQAADAVCDNLLAFDQHLHQEHEPLFARLPDVLTIQDLVAPRYEGKFDLGYLKPLVKRDVLARHRLRYPADMRTNEDLVFLLTLLIGGARVCCLDQPLYVYTTAVGPVSQVRSQSSSTRADDMRLIKALRRLHDTSRPDLAAQDRAALMARIGRLTLTLETAEFDEARWRRQWGTMIRLVLRQPQARRKLVHVVMGKVLSLVRHRVQRMGSSG